MVRHLIPSVALAVLAALAPTGIADAQAPLITAAVFPTHRVFLADTARIQPAPTRRPAGERVRHAAIGGVFGAVTGVATCTLLSITLFGGSGCTAKGNTQFGVGGFLLGAGIGALL